MKTESTHLPPYTRHNEIQVLDKWHDKVDANYFNQVQTALKRIGTQIRFRIPKLNHLDLIVQEDAWIVVDRVLNDMPVVAWTDFEAEGRDNLHEPVDCEIRLFHFAARMVLNRTLNAMQTTLGEALAEMINQHTVSVLPVKNDDAVD
jgi:hypothetical protein